jgi:hypothetical protein
MREDTALADHPRSYLHDQAAVGVDDTDTYQLTSAARELDAHLLHEQHRRVAEVRALLSDLYERDGVAIEDAMLDAQAEEVAAQERAERFLQELCERIQPGAELLEMAGRLDDHALGVWREAAASLVEACPPSLAPLRWRVEEEQRGELRDHARLVRTEAHLGAQLRGYGLAGRLWHRGQVAELRSQLGSCRRLRERSQRRLAYLDAKLQVIQRVEHARGAWIAAAHQVLARGVAAARVLESRATQPAPLMVATDAGEAPMPAHSIPIPAGGLRAFPVVLAGIAGDPKLSLAAKGALRRLGPAGQSTTPPTSSSARTRRPQGPDL